jgi:hypothetical protein
MLLVRDGLQVVMFMPLLPLHYGQVWGRVNRTAVAYFFFCVCKFHSYKFHSQHVSTKTADGGSIVGFIWRFPYERHVYEHLSPLLFHFRWFCMGAKLGL